MAYTSHNLHVGAPRSSLLSTQSTPFPEINLSKFGTGKNSIQAMLQQTAGDDSTEIKRDRDYIRRIIQESKEKKAAGENLSPAEEKHKWNA